MADEHVPANASSLAPAIRSGQSLGILLDRDKVDLLTKQAIFLKDSNLLPAHYQKNPANILMALLRSAALEVEPFTFMEMTYTVHGVLGMKGVFLIALINGRFAQQHAAYKGPLMYEHGGEGDDRYCFAYLPPRNWEPSPEWDEKAPPGSLKGNKITLRMVKLEGWYGEAKGQNEGYKKDRDGNYYASKWFSMGDQMFEYRAAAFFARTRCPELTLGLQTVEELYDIETTGRIVEESRALPEPTPTAPPAASNPSPAAEQSNGYQEQCEGQNSSTQATDWPASEEEFNNALKHLWGTARRKWGPDKKVYEKAMRDKLAGEPYKLTSTRAFRSKQEYEQFIKELEVLPDFQNA